MSEAIKNAAVERAIPDLIDAKNGRAPPARPKNLCDCELSHNGLGMVGRECDCPAGGKG